MFLCSLRYCLKCYFSKGVYSFTLSIKVHNKDLIRISVEGISLEDVDARESVASWFSQGQRSRRPNYRSWPSEGHVTAMEDSP